MTTIMTIVAGYTLTGGCIVVKNPQHIPRIGEKVDMKHGERTEVVNVIYKYPSTEETRIDVVTQEIV
jgi:hypothetical protein